MRKDSRPGVGAAAASGASRARPGSGGAPRRRRGGGGCSRGWGPSAQGGEDVRVRAAAHQHQHQQQLGTGGEFRTAAQLQRGAVTRRHEATGSSRRSTSSTHALAKPSSWAVRGHTPGSASARHRTVERSCPVVTCPAMEEEGADHRPWGEQGLVGRWRQAGHRNAQESDRVLLDEPETLEQAARFTSRTSVFVRKSFTLNIPLAEVLTVTPLVLVPASYGQQARPRAGGRRRGSDGSPEWAHQVFLTFPTGGRPRCRSRRCRRPSECVRTGSRARPGRCPARRRRRRPPSGRARRSGHAGVG